MPDFLPRADAAMLDFARNFTRIVEESHAVLNLPPEVVNPLGEANARFAEAMRRLASPATTTPLAFADKNDARAELENLVRAITRQLRGTPTVDGAMLQSLGLRPRAVRRRAVPVPDQAPDVRVLLAHGRRVTLRLSPANSRRKGKPADAEKAGIFLFDFEPGDGFRLPRLGSTAHSAIMSHMVMPPIFTGRPTVTIELPTSLSPGAMLYVVACWMNYRCQSGPMSRVSRVIVNFDLSPAQVAHLGHAHLAALDADDHRRRLAAPIGEVRAAILDGADEGAEEEEESEITNDAEDAYEEEEDTAEAA